MIAPFKGREPADDQEQELVENYFDALCSCLMFPDNKARALRTHYMNTDAYTAHASMLMPRHLTLWSRVM